jgi:hypothetical protein
MRSEVGVADPGGGRAISVVEQFVLHVGVPPFFFLVA